VPTALVIGASRGLGRALAEELAGRDWTVIATVRDERAAADLDGMEVERLDTTDWPGIDALKQRLADRPLDLLFVNAAVTGPSQGPIGDADPDAFAQMMLTNVLGPLRIADRFAEQVTDTGTVAVMSSSLGSIELNETGGWEAYRTSKAALNMGLRSIAARRRDRRTYLAMDPGWVRTDMGGASADLSIEESIPALADALAARAGQGGVAFVNYQNKDWPW
jgi:NAD(P)-dependent dehydrogenase (short-subunit alcohol dehydrogenase family)